MASRFNRDMSRSKRQRWSKTWRGGWYANVKRKWADRDTSFHKYTRWQVLSTSGPNQALAKFFLAIFSDSNILNPFPYIKGYQQVGISGIKGPDLSLSTMEARDVYLSKSGLQLYCFLNCIGIVTYTPSPRRFYVPFHEPWLTWKTILFISPLTSNLVCPLTVEPRPIRYKPRQISISGPLRSRTLSQHSAVVLVPLPEEPTTVKRKASLTPNNAWQSSRAIGWPKFHVELLSSMSFTQTSSPCKTKSKSFTSVRLTRFLKCWSSGEK